MAPTVQSHSRSHNLLLLQKLLNLRDNASPLTLLLDSLEQSANPVLRELRTRAKNLGTKVIFVSFATVKKLHDVDTFIGARHKELKALQKEISSHFPSTTLSAGKTTSAQRVLVMIDSLNPLISSSRQFIAPFLSGIINPYVSVVAVLHTDIPIVLSRTANEYEPHPLTLVSHLATAILRVSSLHHAIQKRRAQNRSLPEPEWGLDEGREGVLVGLKGADNEATANTLVLEMELRRRSGRALAEKFILTYKAAGTAPGTGGITLLTDHPLFTPTADQEGQGSGTGDDADGMNTTFSLGLTDKQRRDREGVVLPYFDAQTDIGAGEGGRILYDMGREDDFDDEEDEI